MTITQERPALLSEASISEAEPQVDYLRPRRWTTEEYYRLGEAGFFDDQRVELLDGEIWTLPPQGTPHFAAIRRTYASMIEAFGSGFEIREQVAITLDDGTEPEPDVVVVPGSSYDYEDHHPTPPEVRLLVEVSDATLAKDRGHKANMYAAAGIADYWIINLVNRQLEIYRDPILLSDGYGYKFRQVLLASDTVSPLFAPTAIVAVADLFPRTVNKP